MYYDFLVKIPENTGKISKNKRGKTTYIEYTYGRKYLPDKKYNVPQRTTIGKMSDSDSTMMYPNPNFEKFFPEVSLPDCNPSARSSCIKVGAFLVIKKIIEDYGLFDHLNSWDERGKGLLLDLAAYSIISENNAAQHYPEYAYNHPSLTPGHTVQFDYILRIGRIKSFGLPPIFFIRDTCSNPLCNSSKNSVPGNMDF